MEFDGFVRALCHPFIRRALRPIMQNRATVFMLHRRTNSTKGINGHTVEFITEALRILLATGAKFVTVRDIIERWNAGQEIGPEEIAFTFDDGFADQAELLREAFIPAGCPATVFLVTDFLDGKLWPWDDQLAYIFKKTQQSAITLQINSQQFALEMDSADERHRALKQIREHLKGISNERLYAQISDIAAQMSVELPTTPPEEYRPMTWDDARHLSQQGIDFGPHTLTHRIMSQLSPRESQIEIEGSWARLKQELLNPLPVLAWPTGRLPDFAQKDIRIAQKLGLHAAMATENDYSHMTIGGDHDDIFRIKRFALPDNTKGVLRYGSWLERGRQLLPI